MVSIGVIGCGYWGPKLARNFYELPETSLKWVCDFRSDRLDHMRTLYPGIRTTDEYFQVLNSDVDAVVLATPVYTHCRLAMQALRAGKHVLVEKPLAASSAEARQVVDEAERRGLTVMVGHTFVYNPAVEAIREIVAGGELGEIYYVNGTRVNLGLFQPDINVLWDLAPHDISILLYVLGSEPYQVSARGGVYVRRERGIHEVAHLSARFPNGVLADVRVSWLDPVKVRKYTIVGSRKMLVYDDIADDKVLIFDKGVEIPPYSDTEQQFQASYRQGDAVSYPIDWQEPLRLECREFARSVEQGSSSRSDGIAGLKVVQILEAADKSLHNGGAWEALWEPVTAGSGSRPT